MLKPTDTNLLLHVKDETEVQFGKSNTSATLCTAHKSVFAQ